ncbi:GMC family oxidoreductase [Brachybacterium sp.]|uniref:GMC family oxidoreductase n=1 Tax=Brachybacterium sp. TaxID=1891286 RepID=UPI003F8F0BBD
MGTPHYDYIVIGAGAAGAPVASRLTEDGSKRVLLLEAGGRDWNPLIHMPMGFTKLTTPDVNWGYETVPQKQLNNRRMHYPQGRTLGGSTSINAMIYIRGNAGDYDAWRDLGNEDWGYDDVLPFFKKSENNERLNDKYHGTGGPMNVTEQAAHNELSKAYVRAAQELGLKYNPDLNGAVQEGVSYYDVTQRNHRRESAATAFINPARKRPNLTIATRSEATRLIINNGHVTGLEYTQNGKPQVAYASREVVLSGGAINSPRLMMLSGIGPADELAALGIEVVHDLPGVGKNLQDHMDTYITSHSAPLSYNESDRPLKMLSAGLQYLLYRTGPVTATVCEAGLFTRSSDQPEHPDIQLHMLPAYVIDHGRQRVRGHGFTINTCFLRPRSIGQVTLQSSDPKAPPAIDPNFLDDPYDRQMSLEAFEFGREMLATEAFAPYVKSEHMPGAHVTSKKQIMDYIRRWSKTDYHPVGTCKMGNDPMAVVGTDLKVHGIEGLRVVDASIMPKLISGNTQAPSIMIGEKGAHHILQDI